MAKVLCDAAGPEPAADNDKILSQSSAVARLYGEPLFTIPRDLYIPPDALEVFLDAFEGPLDLLLYLIRRQNFNVLDIPMVQLTDQYLTYVRQLQERNLELAGEYLLMAAVLIEIKSRMLLPPPASSTEEDEEDPRAELVRRLLEYERIKSAAQLLDGLPRADRDFYWANALGSVELVPRLPKVCAYDLRDAWLAVVERARLNTRHQVAAEGLSVRVHMSEILQRLADGRVVEFSDLFAPAMHRGHGLAIIVVHFLALLELVRESLLDITQAQPYAPIYIRLANASAAA